MSKRWNNGRFNLPHGRGPLHWALILSIVFIATALALTPKSALAAPKSLHHKVIDFDDEVVEGVNKRPFDSLSHLSEAEKRRRKTHLYRKRTGFSTEVTATLQSLRYTP